MRSLCRAASHPALLLCLAVVLPGGWRQALSAAAAGPLTVSVSLEPVEIRVGDVARLTVTVDHPAAGSLELPELDRGKAIVVTDRKRETVALAGGLPDGQERTTFVLLLTSFEPGEHRVGGGEIAFTDRGIEARRVPFPDTTLRTRSVLPGGDAPMRGIKDLARWPAPRGRWAGPAAGLLLLVSAVLFAVRRRKGGRRVKPTPGQATATPHQTAMQALAALRRGMRDRQQQSELFYRELSSLVRRYIEERFGLRAPELTTEELIREAAGSGLLAPAHQAVVKAFLEQCDLVKFARHRPSPGDMTQALDAAERLVRETICETQGVAGP